MTDDLATLAAADQDTAMARHCARAVVAFVTELQSSGIPLGLIADLTRKWFDSYLAQDAEDDDAA